MKIAHGKGGNNPTLMLVPHAIRMRTSGGSRVAVNHGRILGGGTTQWSHDRDWKNQAETCWPSPPRSPKQREGQGTTGSVGIHGEVPGAKARVVEEVDAMGGFNTCRGGYSLPQMEPFYP